jgi:hypothetical protein
MTIARCKVLSSLVAAFGLLGCLSAPLFPWVSQREARLRSNKIPYYAMEWDGMAEESLGAGRIVVICSGIGGAGGALALIQACRSRGGGRRILICSSALAGMAFLVGTVLVCRSEIFFELPDCVPVPEQPQAWSGVGLPRGASYGSTMAGFFMGGGCLAALLCVAECMVLRRSRES